MYRSYGVSIPGYQFRGASDLDQLSPDAIRIEVQDDPPLRDFGDQEIPGPNTLKSLAVALRAADERTLPNWITPETTKKVLSQLPPHTKLRLESKYSVTDLKRLLRRVVQWDSAGVRASGTYDRYPTWLITSLVFWNLFDENNMDVENMAKHLRETEEASFKLGSGQIPASSSPIGKHLENGVKALVADDVKTADYEFGEAKKLDSNQAARLFPALWSQQLPAVWLRDFRQGHPVMVDTVTLSHPEQLDLQDLSGIVDPKRDGAAWRELSLYRVASSEYGDGDNAASIVTSLLASANSPELTSPGACPTLLGNGYGVLLESTGAGSHSILVQGNSIHDYSKEGVGAIGNDLTATVTGNVITGLGPAAGYFFQFGVFILNGAVGRIEGNQIAEGDCGTLNQNDCINARSEGVVLRAVGDGSVVDHNVISRAQSGIFINNANKARITNNLIGEISALDGIDAQGMSNSLLRNNSISNATPLGNQSCGIVEFPGMGSAGGTEQNNLIINTVVNDAWCGLAYVQTTTVVSGQYSNVQYTQFRSDIGPPQ